MKYENEYMRNTLLLATMSDIIKCIQIDVNTYSRKYLHQAPDGAKANQMELL